MDLPPIGRHGVKASGRAERGEGGGGGGGERDRHRMPGTGGCCGIFRVGTEQGREGMGGLEGRGKWQMLRPAGQCKNDLIYRSLWQWLAQRSWLFGGV